MNFDNKLFLNKLYKHCYLNYILSFSHKTSSIKNMAASKIDWSQFLGEDSELPPDIVFNVMEQGEKEEDEILNLEDWKTCQVPAHKFLLAGVSPVFRREFFGPLKTTKDIIDIKETTIEAFTAMINYICMPDGLRNISCPQTLCQILNLAERYDIVGLKESITQKLQQLTITSENMMFTATIAKNYAVFEDVSKMLINKCGAFLKSRFQTPAQVFDFLHCSHSSFPDADTELLIELLRANGTCPNCNMNSNDCLDGVDVRIEHTPKMPVGVKVSWKNWAPGTVDNCGFPCSDSDVPSSGLAEVTNLNPFTTRYKQHSPMNTLPLKCVGHDKSIVVRFLFSTLPKIYYLL
jgi:hypothetical protein